MKKLTKISFLFAAILLVSCSDSVVEKPENLIPEDTMAKIIYDLAVLEALQSQKQIYLITNNIDPDKYIYDKYNIDSLRFAKSTQFYAADIERYKKLYERVGKRLEKHRKATDSLAKKNGQPNAPQDPDAPRVE